METYEPSATIRRANIVAAISLYGWMVAVCVVTGFRGHPYSTGGLAKHQFLTYGQSTEILLAAAIAFGVYWIARYDRKAGAAGVMRPWLWLAVSAAFVGAAYDKMFELHEKALPVIVAAVPAVRVAHDALITTYGIGAVIFTVFFVKELRAVRLSARLYVGALVLFVFSTGVDYLQVNWVPGTRAFTISSILEELSQYAAETTFALAFLSYGVDRVLRAVYPSNRHLDKPVDEVCEASGVV